MSFVSSRIGASRLKQQVEFQLRCLAANIVRGLFAGEEAVALCVAASSPQANSRQVSGFCHTEVVSQSRQCSSVNCGWTS